MATARKITKKRTATAKMQVKAASKSGRTALARSRSAQARKRTTLPKSKSNGNLNGKLSGEGKAKPLLNQKEMLQQERTQVESELARLRAEMQEAPEMTGDEVDLNVYEREKTLGLVAAYERRLEEIDATLKVAAQGKYGICERCGKAIDPERLSIFPETRLCVSCKNEVEKEQRRLRM